MTAVDKSITYPAARPLEATLDYTVAGEIGTEVAGFTGSLGYVSTLGTNPLPGSYTDAIVQGGLQLADNGAFKADNYAIDFVKGDLTVASGTFSVSLTDASAVYDGSAHSATLNGTQSGDSIQYFVKIGSLGFPATSQRDERQRRPQGNQGYRLPYGLQQCGSNRNPDHYPRNPDGDGER